MATLSLNNPTRTRNQALHHHKPISKTCSLTRPTKVPFTFSTKTPPKLPHIRPIKSVSESSLSVPKEAEAEIDDFEDDPTQELSYLDEESDPESITEWELDFCSRPILDIRGKKMWELVVCDNSLSLQYTKYFPNNVINSITLKDAIVTICDDLGVPLPEKIRFFRSQMQTIITKACKELGIKPIPSKRTNSAESLRDTVRRIKCVITLRKLDLNSHDEGILSFIHVVEMKFIAIHARYAQYLVYIRECLVMFQCLSLLLWLEERYETVYTRHPGFQKGSKPLLALDNPFPMELPENLFGERWAFVQLPFSAVKEEVSSLETKFMFGASLDLDLLGIEIDDKTLIPGLAVASSRAKPLAAWMNGLEVCSIEADTARGCLILSVGISTRYVYATYNKNPVTTSEAEAWEAAKKTCGGLHFLAIQEDLDSDDCVGIWLLLDLPPPPV